MVCEYAIADRIPVFVELDTVHCPVVDAVIARDAFGVERHDVELRQVIVARFVTVQDGERLAVLELRNSHRAKFFRETDLFHPLGERPFYIVRKLFFER
jgi:hypothetical protein